MISRGGGSIVNPGSVAGQFGWPHRLACPCSKAAIDHLTGVLGAGNHEWNGRIELDARASAGS